MAEKNEIKDKAEKKPEAAKEKKPSFGKRVSAFFREYKSEFKKIVWSPKKDVTKNTAVVVVLVVIVSAIVAVLDLAFWEGLQSLAIAI